MTVSGKFFILFFLKWNKFRSIDRWIDGEDDIDDNVIKIDGKVVEGGEEEGRRGVQGFTVINVSITSKRSIN